MKFVRRGDVVLVVFFASACAQHQPLYCDAEHPCTEVAGKTFCDLEGAYPESEGHGRTCISPPFDAGIPAADAAIDGGSATFDASAVDAGPDAGPEPGMVFVPGGTFTMGCNAAVDDCTVASAANELP